LGLLAILGFNGSIIMADQNALYRANPTLSYIFNVSSTILLILFIIPLVAGILLFIPTVSEKTGIKPTDEFWVVGRMFILICCFIVQYRIRKRRRVTFLT
jgi:hypothetical protein